jgi:hypothetical protein
MKNNYLGVYALLLVLFSFVSNAQKISASPFAIHYKNHVVAFSSASPSTHSKITYEIITAANKTWCYDILADGKIMIHKPSVPGLLGNERFKTISAAQKAADLVKQKIKNGEIPPSITTKEMQKIGSL